MQPLVFSPILHHATHLLPQSRYTYVDPLAVTHDFLIKHLSCIHQVLKGICEGRDNWLHHKVYHPIAISIMKEIKKALSEQLHDLVSTFVCISDFTKPVNNWLHP